MDTFRGPEDSNVDLSAIDIVLCFTQKSKNLSANDKKTNDNDNMEADSNDEEDREENNNNNDDGKQTPVIEVRGYKIEFESSKNSDSTNGNPTIKLLEHGPFMDLSIRRTRLVSLLLFIRMIFAFFFFFLTAN